MKKNHIISIITLLCMGVIFFSQRVYADAAPSPVVLGFMAVVILGIVLILVAVIVLIIIIILKRKKNGSNKPH